MKVILNNKMKEILLPDRIFGKNTDEALERVLKGDAQQAPAQNQTQANAPDLNGFIYVPTIKLHVAKEKTLHGKNFYEAQKEMQNQSQKMLTPYEFAEFLKYLKEDYQKINKSESDKILDEILTVRNPWRSEWLDHDYKKEKTGLYVLYHKFNSRGNIELVKELLDKDTLMEDKTPGINFEDYLNNHTIQGLPKNNIKNGDLYYWFPRDDNNSVARFNADSDWADLFCVRDSSDSDSSLGVRAAKFSTGNKG